MSETDAVLEQIAAELERPNFLDMSGVFAKRKRAREDAELRSQARQDQRRELASWVRSFKSDKGNSPLDFLRTVEEGRSDQYEWGPEVAAALVSQFVTATLEIDLSSHLPNCEKRFHFALTDAGKKRLGLTPSPVKTEAEE